MVRLFFHKKPGVLVLHNHQVLIGISSLWFAMSANSRHLYTYKLACPWYEKQKRPAALCCRETTGCIQSHSAVKKSKGNCLKKCVTLFILLASARTAQISWMGALVPWMLFFIRTQSWMGAIVPWMLFLIRTQSWMGALVPCMLFFLSTFNQLHL